MSSTARTFALTPTASPHRDVKAYTFEKLPVDGARLFRRLRVVRNGVELHDRPTVERHVGQRTKYTLQVDSTLTQLDEPIRRAARLDVLDVEEQQSITVPPNGGNRISAALRIVRDVEEQLHVASIAGRENSLRRIGRFADRPHVVVIPGEHTEVRRASSDFTQDVAEARDVVRR